MSFSASIRNSIVAFTLFFLSLMIAVGGTAIVGFRSVDQNAALLHQRWLGGARILGEISDRISEFHLAETYRALAKDSQGRSRADRLADEHRTAVRALLEEYAGLAEAQKPAADRERFEQAWSAYMAQHDAWVSGEVLLEDRDPSNEGSALNRGYLEADEAVDRLIEANMAAAKAEVADADRTVDGATTLVVAVLAAAAALSVYLLLRMMRSIVLPVGRITRALLRLAEGDKSVEVPGIERRDEIGAMAKALQVFRTNALALERAHEEAQAAQQRADTLARHDALTGLPNRRLFALEIEKAIEHSQGGETCFLFLVDLDRFKPVNDVFGHAIGDAVLCEVAGRLKDIVGKAGTAARLGGDEFAIVYRSTMRNPGEEAAELAQRIVHSLGEPYRLEDRDVAIGASVGIAFAPDDGSDAESLMRAADLAMYQAKQDGRGKFRFFEQRMDEQLREKAALETDLRLAIQRDEIVPYYQPLMDLDAQRVHSFEVLSRWTHPERGPVPPVQFIPLIEGLGLTSELTSMILRRACREARGWGADVKLAVNIWPAQLQDTSLPLRIMSILSKEGFPPSRLEVEVTESALVGDIDTARIVLGQLRSLGITVALDDFGTGYSSLYHLRELKFDKLKIDRSFVLSMQDNPESGKIVDAMLSLARSLSISSVAEGIESDEAREHLAERGCQYGQGYLFSQAVTADAAAALVARFNGAANAAAPPAAQSVA